MTSSRYRRPEPARLEQRKAPRQKVAIERTTVKRRTQTEISAKLQDMSIFGCCLVLDAVLRAEEAIKLTFEGSEPVEAIVIWQKAGRAGCRFEQPISRKLFRSMTLQV